MTTRGASLIEILVVLVAIAGVVLLGLTAVGVISWGSGVPMSLADFVKAVHVHGVPYDRAAGYPHGSIDTLLGWLDDPAWSPHWQNIAITIGMIGPKTAAQVDRMIDFVEKPSAGPVTIDEYAAKQATMIGLGYAANKMSDTFALRYLIGSSLPSQWTDGRRAWSSPHGESPAQVQRQLARLGVIALGLSGRAKAITRLELLRDKFQLDPLDQAFRIASMDIIAEAISSHSTISGFGLGKYYLRR